MRKGVILEVNDVYITCLTPEGEFMRTRKLQQDYRIGEEIDFLPLEVNRVRQSKLLPFLNRPKGRIVTLAAAIILLVTVLFPLYHSRQVYAYMSIDVNPSIEIGLNEKLKVISMKAYNEDGEKIVAHLTDWKQEAAGSVAEKVLDEIEKQGYLKQQKNVVIATVNSGDPKGVPDVELKETVTKLKKATQDVLDVIVVTGTTVERENAVKQGVTTGVYKQTHQGGREKVTPTYTELEQPTPTNKLQKQLEQATKGIGKPNNKPNQKQQLPHKNIENQHLSKNGRGNNANEKNIERKEQKKIKNNVNTEQRTNNHGQFKRQHSNGKEKSNGNVGNRQTKGNGNKGSKGDNGN